MDADVIIIGGGLAGLVASNELVRAGKSVAIVDQENAANLGGCLFTGRTVGRSLASTL
jgi:predicted oxidoreductase